MRTQDDRESSFNGPLNSQITRSHQRKRTQGGSFVAVPKPLVPQITTSMTLSKDGNLIKITFTPSINFILPFFFFSLLSHFSHRRIKNLLFLQKIEAYIAVQRENIERVRYNFKIHHGTTFSCGRL